MLEIITTSDGSHSLLNTDLGETYHSTHGAIQESKHVFIREGLAVLPARQSAIRILEIGFGTGLNALLSRIYAEENKLNITYESWELFPLPSAIVSALNYGSMLKADQAFREIHEAAWEVLIPLTPAFHLLKRKRDVRSAGPETDLLYDLIYYDAFAPSRQPEMWQCEILQKVTSLLSSDGILVTYCAKGQVKRDLRSLGLVVETLPGPPGKKEMTRARRTFRS